MKRTTRATGPLTRRPAVHTAAAIAALTLGIAGLGVVIAAFQKIRP